MRAVVHIDDDDGPLHPGLSPLFGYRFMYVTVNGQFATSIGVLRRLIIRLPVRVIRSIAFHQTAETAASYERVTIRRTIV